MNTVEDFWGVWNSAVLPTLLPFGSNYHLFRDGIKPAWEDSANANGGKWVFNIPKPKRDPLFNDAFVKASFLILL